MNAVAKRLTALAATLGLLTLGSVSTVQAESLKGWEQKALNLGAAHRKSQGEGVTVAVLDSGVVPDHPAVKGHVKTGKDFVDNGTKAGSPNWGGRGTARASNVLQVAPKAKILSVRVLTDPGDKGEQPDFGGRNNPLVQGIKYAADHGADIISMSFGTVGVGPRDYNKFVVDALSYAAHKGIPVLASAGNGGKDSYGNYPAGYSSVISVAASDKSGKPTEESSVRIYNAIAAPGERIKSAKNTGGIIYSTGTATATAVASGVTALVLAENPKLTPAQVRALLIQSTGAKKYSAPVGHGQVNAAAAVSSASSPPSVKTGPVEHEGNRHLARPDGQSRFSHPPLDTGGFYTGIGAAVVGLLMLVGTVLLIARARRNKTPQPPAAVPYQGAPPQR